ncbi:hypothetical protein DPMN_133676 [Dreissena polymorpha]|uniref:C1q domain-containing protein n=1 Tax=Dreissena polymorpha TaxID=45954 RepID=A0A9D4FUS3_DREPO|nr:hypothetical protein DPMN_133676 [Dreissena polymorpha]
MNAKVVDALKQIEDAKDSLKVPTLYFRARITASTTDFSSGQDLVFPSVEVNEGKGYDSSTGKFTASITGMYLFSVQCCVHYQKYGYIEIVHQDKTLQRSTHYDSTGAGSCVTMQVSTPVSMGHQVWVRATGSSSLYADSSHRYTSFCGTLIHM